MKHWIFDLDGTLVDSLTVHFNVMEKIFSYFNHPFSNQTKYEILKVSARTLPEYFTTKFGSKKAPEAIQMFHTLNSAEMHLIKPFDGITQLLRTLKDKDLNLAVWTARDLNSTLKILDQSGLSDFFSICVSGTCTPKAKPHPEGLQKIADHFESNPESMVMIGDFDSDMQGAQAFGSKAIRVLWHNDVEKKRCEMAHWQFEKVEHFQKWINENH